MCHSPPHFCEWCPGCAVSKCTTVSAFHSGGTRKIQRRRADDGPKRDWGSALRLTKEPVPLCGKKEEEQGGLGIPCDGEAGNKDFHLLSASVYTKARDPQRGGSKAHVRKCLTAKMSKVQLALARAVAGLGSRSWSREERPAIHACCHSEKQVSAH